jgi:uncharacterized phage-associated protein
MRRPWFNVRKAAQVVAYFAKAQGNRINVLKVVKLFYLANRNSMGKLGFPLVNDILVSMDQGPVNSITYDYINGFEDDRAAWEEFVTDREHYFVGLVNTALTVDDLDELSDAEITILAETWKEVGHLSKWDIRDYTHDHCPEWEDPDGSSLPIPYARVFKFLGKENSDELASRVMDRRRILEAISG